MAASFGHAWPRTMSPLHLRVSTAERQAWRRLPSDRIFEHDVENALLRQLGGGTGGRTIRRQVACCDQIPDLVIEWGAIVTLVEIKRDQVDQYGVGQILGYCEHWKRHLEKAPGWHEVYGVLVAPSIPPRMLEWLPSWVMFQPIVIERVRSVA